MQDVVTSTPVSADCPRIGFMVVCLINFGPDCHADKKTLCYPGLGGDVLLDLAMQGALLLPQIAFRVAA